jgi:hypothetical protein
VAFGRAAGTDSPVTLTGESGTGKELFAPAIHAASARREKPFIVVTCRASAENVLEAAALGAEVDPYLLLSNGGRPSEALLFRRDYRCGSRCYRILPKRVTAQSDRAYCVIVAAHNTTGSRSMEPDTLVQQQDFVDVPGEPTDVATPVELQVNADDAARSEKNILQWMSYLPEDCIRTMIEMGWDVTT